MGVLGQAGGWLDSQAGDREEEPESVSGVLRGASVGRGSLGRCQGGSLWQPPAPTHTGHMDTESLAPSVL